jgi:hypothetical protein
MYVCPGAKTIEEIDMDQSTFCKVLVAPKLCLAGQSSALMIALQQASEWLRLLLLILPAAHLQPINEKVCGGSKRKKNDDLDASEEGKILVPRRGYGRQLRSSLLCFLFRKGIYTDSKPLVL